VATINTPHVFQGIKGEVTVPPSSNARDKFFECNFLSRYALAYILPGRRIDMYCSEAVAFVKKAETIVAAIRLPADFATFRIWLTMACSIPTCAMMPPKIIPTIVKDTVYIIDSMPPRLNRLSTI